MVHLASDYAGVDITTDNGAAAFKALEELKPNLVKTYAKSSDLANMFAAGEIQVAIVADYGVPMITEAVPSAEFIVPEGTYANFNTIDIVANSENKDLAYEYINFRLDAALQTETAVALNEAPVNKEVVLDEATAVNKTYGEVAAAAKSIDYSFVNPLLNDWIDQWNRLINN